MSLYAVKCFLFLLYNTKYIKKRSRQYKKEETDLRGEKKREEVGEKKKDNACHMHPPYKARLCVGRDGYRSCEEKAERKKLKKKQTNRGEEYRLFVVTPGISVGGGMVSVQFPSRAQMATFARCTHMGDRSKRRR
jgi:hypothetical protein